MSKFIKINTSGEKEESSVEGLDIVLDTTNFNNNLSATDTDVQKALDTLDDMSGGGGSSNETVVIKTADYTVTTSDKNVLCDCTNGSITLTMPAVVGNDGLRYYIKKVDDSDNTVTIVGNSSEYIDLDTELIIQFENSAVELILYNAKWYIN